MDYTSVNNFFSNQIYTTQVPQGFEVETVGLGLNLRLYTTLHFLLQYTCPSSSGSRDGPSVYHAGYYSTPHPPNQPPLDAALQNSVSFPTTHFSDVYHHRDQPAGVSHQVPSNYVQWSSQNVCYPPSHPLQNTVSILDEFHAPAEVPLHAPVPIAGYSPLLSCSTQVQNNHYATAPLSTPAPISHQITSKITVPAPQPSLEDSSQFPQHQGILNFYAKASEQTFPTPSELLSQLTGMPPCPSAPEPDKKFESQRKARYRAVAQSVGFEPTDP